MGDTGQVKGDLDVMRGVTSKLANDYSQLQQQIQWLSKQAEAHSATWSGEAKTAWNLAMTDVNSAWDRLNNVLHEIASNITTSGSRYGETDTANAAGYRQVDAGHITSTLNR